MAIANYRTYSMTGFLTISVALALLAPAVSKGSYPALLQQRWSWKSLLAGALILQAVADRLPHPGHYDLGFGALIASYVLLLAFCGRNLIKTGMAVVMIGIAINTATIATNHGMPVAVPNAWGQSTDFAPTVKHHAHSSETTLYWLSDVIYLRPTDQMISFGDLVLAIGLIDVAFHASRKRRTRLNSAHRSPQVTLNADVNGDLDLASLEIVNDDELTALLRASAGMISDGGSHAAQRHELQRIDH